MFDALYIAACFTITLSIFLIALKDQLGKAFTASRFVNRSEFFKVARHGVARKLRETGAFPLFLISISVS